VRNHMNQMTFDREKHAFVIEDDTFLKEMLEKNLTGNGYRVNGAVTGEDALVALNEMNDKPDIILLDIILPGIDGFEVLEKLRDIPELSKIPVVVLSNFGEQTHKNRAMKLGAIGYFIKADLIPADVIARIDEFLSKSRQ
jgi:DNA-binding response OmpR family regulator